MWQALQHRVLVLSQRSNLATPATSSNILRSLSTQQQQHSQQATTPEVITFLRLNNLQDNPGAVKKKRRVGRGVGSSKGKTCGRGMKGQKARGKVHPTFEGGQTKFYKLFPKRGFNNKRHAAEQFPLNLGTLQDYIDMGRLDATKLITLREMQVAGMFKANAVKHGVKLLANGKERLKQPLKIHVSRASSAAIEAVESAGGQISSVHYNRLALRALLRPHRFEGKLKIRQARPPPKWQPYYTSFKNRGYLNPAIQLRAWFDKDPRPELQARFDEIRKQQTETHYDDED